MKPPVNKSIKLIYINIFFLILALSLTHFLTFKTKLSSVSPDSPEGLNQNNINEIKCQKHQIFVNNISYDQETLINANPGDRIHIKAGCFNYNSKVSLELLKEVGSKELMSNDYGFIETDFTLPTAGGGLHTLSLLGDSPAKVMVGFEIMINYSGRPKDEYAAYLCGFSPNLENNNSEQVDILIDNEVLDTTYPNEKGCVKASIPFEPPSTTYPLTLMAKSKKTGKISSIIIK